MADSSSSSGGIGENCISFISCIVRHTCLAQSLCSNHSLGPAETTSLLPSPPDRPITLCNIESKEHYKFPQSKAVKRVTRTFYFLCVLTGQYVKFRAPSPNQEAPASNRALIWASKCVLICIVLVALALNLSLNVSAVLFDVYAVAFCPFSKHCGFIYSNLHLIAPTLNQFGDWKKAVITTATLSGALSYLLMAWVLYRRYTRLSKIPLKCSFNEPEYRKEFSRSCPNKLVINPFVDDEYMVGDSLKDIDTTNKLDNGDGSDGGEGSGAGGDRKQKQYVSSLLTPKQCVYFQLMFWFNFCVYTASVGIFICILVRRLDSFNAILEGLDLAGLIAQFVSQFAALISCFIFSKIAYAVSNRCIDFSKCIFQVANTPRVTKNDQEEVETNNWRNLKARLGFSAEKKVDHLTVLKVMDQRYTLMLKNSLSPFGLWFTIHWVLYTLTAFMSIAYVADEIIMELYGTEPQDVKCHWEKDLNCRQSLAYTMLFALFHCILFLYPCFRAASVTKVRKNMIKSVSREEWSEISLTEKLL